MRELVLKTWFSLGDVVMLTAAVRDLHRCYPGQFATDVRTHFPELWENNPYVTCLDEKGESVEVINCRYPLINQANYRPYHCLHGYVDFLNAKLNLRIVPTEFRGDIHLAHEERGWASQVHELTDLDIPFWIVSAGGKHDITIKWWSIERYQEVIDHFRGRIAFVQIGQLGHHHPKLQHTIDLRGETSVRELIRLVYHSQGCLCPVTSLMHLAAAVETRPGCPPNRPCVVVAGGREPANWEAYPHHQFLHTVGALPCCGQGGCWKSRIQPLGDGDERDKPDSLCTNVVDHLPRCMDLITAREVIQKIEAYFAGGALQFLTAAQATAAERGVRASQSNSYELHSLNQYNAAQAIERVIDTLPASPAGFNGRGIVICGGGLKYFPCAWVCIRMLRHLGCQLPIQLWYMGSQEMDSAMVGLIESLGAHCVDATQVEKEHPRRASGGWELKPYAILHSRFEEVLLLDADNVPVQDPTCLFEARPYQHLGAVFWPDYGCLAADRDIWRVCGVPYRPEPEFESGQLIVHKAKCWRPLNLALWFNEHSDFFFQHIHGDKETFHLAWRKLDQPYAMISTPIESLKGIMCQHDFNGNRLFQHRNSHKWRAFAENVRVPGFQLEEVCLEFIKELEQRWSGTIHVEMENAVREGPFVFRRGTCDRNVFQDVVNHNEYELPVKFAGRDVIIDIGAHIGSFSYACLHRGAKRVLAFEPEPENFRLAQYNLRSYSGRVRLYQKAIWRSDRHPGMLLHSGYTDSGVDVNTGGGTVLVDGEATSVQRRKEVVLALGLDAVLRRFKSVRLVKLDCEGSEWPILLTSKLLHRVQTICGEFHELEEIPTAAQVDGYHCYTRNELELFLRKRYSHVRIRSGSDSRLGHFWAE